jgi:hypothetical protein
VLANLMTFKLTSTKHPIIKEFLQSIIWLNVNIIKFVVQRVPLIITKNHVAKDAFTKNQNHEANAI